MDGERFLRSGKDDDDAKVVKQVRATTGTDERKARANRKQSKHTRNVLTENLRRETVRLGY